MKSEVVKIRSRKTMQHKVASYRSDGRRIGFVPTMGALHDGHLSLIKRAREHSDIVVASIFVNPTQFAPGEDLETYPRTEAEDLAKLDAAGCDMVYLPTVEDMYPEGSVTNVRVEELSDLLDGQHRPHFFYGVATVVARLFVHVTPDVAVFGEKDYQQLQIIRRMVRDLGFPIEVLGGATVRDPDGLAQSSRNLYLSPDERQRAVAISQALRRAVREIESGEAVGAALKAARAHILEAGFSQLDYVSAVHPATLKDLSTEAVAPGFEGRILAAAWMGQTRLIDNMGFKRPE